MFANKGIQIFALILCLCGVWILLAHASDYCSPFHYDFNHNLFFKDSPNCHYSVSAVIILLSNINFAVIACSSCLLTGAIAFSIGDFLNPCL